MSFELGEVDGKIGGAIIRLVCGLSGLVGIWTLVNGLVSWLNDSSAYSSIWNALAGDEPYCHFAGRSVSLGGGWLWKKTPNGMLPALYAICLSASALCAAIFNRLWMYGVVVALLFLA